SRSRAGWARGTAAHPPRSSTAGSVTSLRRKAGELFLIQLDAALNPGNAGGPVLDRAGKVVGVVTAGVKGGVNFAVPVNVLGRFLARPDVQFTPPAVTPANRGRPLLFEARAVPVLPSAGTLAMELILRGADGKERKHRLERQDDMFRTTAVPFPETVAPRVQVTLTYPDGAATGAVADQALTVAGQQVRLSEVRS